MTTEIMSPIAPNSNPFHYDAFHMGQYVGKTICIMYANHSINDYIIVVNIPTGERTKLIFNEENAETAGNFAEFMDTILKFKGE
jgi:hypothetical protein